MLSLCLRMTVDVNCQDEMALGQIHETLHVQFLHAASLSAIRGLALFLQGSNSYLGR